MKLSIVIICWNDAKVIMECLRSIYESGCHYEFEVVVSDNGSTDDSKDLIRQNFPLVKIVENGENLGFARGNNAGIAKAIGEYVLILNPDTIVHHGALSKLVAFAEARPNAGAFGCRVLNPDGTFQNPARPLPTPLGYWIAATNMRAACYMSDAFLADLYLGWDGKTERAIGYQSGCCVLVRAAVLEELGGFDEQFFYHFEETDLCKRVWDAGYSIIYCPDAVITHLGGQSVGRFPVRFALETCRNRYRYFYKHFGRRGAKQLKWIWLTFVGLRWALYRVSYAFNHSESLKNRLNMYAVVFKWNWQLRPIEFVRSGAEPNLGYAPLRPAAHLTATV